jgi:eukaryotic-like serine/threonine-protein kinase
MGSIVNVNPKLDRVSAQPGGRVAFSFSVVNTSARPLKIGAKVIAEGMTETAWFSVLGDGERRLGADDLDQFDVEASLPAGLAPGNYRFKLLVYSTDDPGEDFDESPSVVASVTAAPAPEEPEQPAPKPPEPQKPFPWWIVAVAGVAVIVIGVLAFVFWPAPEPAQPEQVQTVTVPRVLTKPLDEAKRILAEHGLEAATVAETRPSGDNSKLNVVRYQFPKIGTRVDPGTEVNLVYYTSKVIDRNIFIRPNGAVEAVPMTLQPQIGWKRLQTLPLQPAQ